MQVGDIIIPDIIAITVIPFTGFVVFVVIVIISLEITICYEIVHKEHQQIHL